jgi:hypothetical protein
MKKKITGSTIETLFNPAVHSLAKLRSVSPLLIWEGQLPHGNQALRGSDSTQHTALGLFGVYWIIRVGVGLIHVRSRCFYVFDLIGCRALVELWLLIRRSIVSLLH